MSWLKPLRKEDPGEVGRVYYVNTKCIFKDNEEWTKNDPFTINPENGITIEDTLKNSTDIPHTMKADLIAKRYTEQRLTSGIYLKIWISEEAAPEWWSPTPKQIYEKTMREAKPLLYGANGYKI